MDLNPGLTPKSVFPPSNGHTHFHTRKDRPTAGEVKCKDRNSLRKPSGSFHVLPIPQECLSVGGWVRERPGWAGQLESARVCACLCAPGKETEQADKISRFQSKAPIKHKADVSK